MSWRLVSGTAVHPPSGKKSVSSAAQPTKDLLSYTAERPSTPEELKPFRKTLDPGSKTTWAPPPPTDEHFVFGTTTEKSVSAADVIAPALPRLAQEEIERKESIFNHTPVGRAKRTAGNLPEWLAEKESEVAFGAPPQPVEPLVLFATPPVTPPGSTSGRNSLIEPPGAFHRPGAGETVKRYQDWHVDAVSTVFGSTPKKPEVDVSKTLQWASSGVQNPEKPSVRLRKEDLTFDKTQQVYGIKTPIVDDVREVIHATPESHRIPDDNIGKSKNAEFLKTNGLDDTTFGMSTRRETRRPPEHNAHSIQPTAVKPSMQTHTQDRVADVMFPPKNNRAAFEGFWAQLRSKEELRDIMSSAIRISDQEFELAFARASGGSTQSSIAEVKNAWAAIQVEAQQRK